MSGTGGIVPPHISDAIFLDRLKRLVADIDLGMDCQVDIGTIEEQTPTLRYLQIACWRKDVITGEMGLGYGAQGFVSDRMTDSQIVQVAFGLYLAYWTHEARENFQWRGRRVFGPHIATEALWDAAIHVDVRSARHEDDRPR